MRHCVEKIQELLVGGKNDRRTILQIGYNLGRLSELTQLGREPFWDLWKAPIADWDVPRLADLAAKLPGVVERGGCEGDS